MNINEVFLNASEHLFNLSFAETLMLRNYSKINKLRFCTMAGGSESIRDIQEAKNLQADGLEFNMVESLFALDKIFAFLHSDLICKTIVKGPGQNFLAKIFGHV